MADKYPDNSDKSREQKNEPSPMPAKVEEKKLSPFMTVFTMIFSDTPDKIVKNFLKYRLVPCFADFLHQAGNNFLDEAFNGRSNSPDDDRPFRDNRVKRSGNYDRFQEKLADNRKRSLAEKRPLDYRDLTWRTRNEAERVLGDMKDELRRHPRGVTVAKLFDFYGMDRSDYPYTFNDWCWKSLDGVEVKLAGANDFYIDLPKPVEFEDD